MTDQLQRPPRSTPHPKIVAKYGHSDLTGLDQAIYIQVRRGAELFEQWGDIYWDYISELDEDPEGELVDMITAILHFVTQCRHDTTEVLAQAWEHFIHEIGEVGDAYTS